MCAHYLLYNALVISCVFLKSQLHLSHCQMPEDQNVNHDLELDSGNTLPFSLNTLTSSTQTSCVKCELILKGLGTMDRSMSCWVNQGASSKSGFGR